MDRAEQFGDKVVYQVYIRSFKDSNDDGIGDLRGITYCLDYLKELGVDCVWITPFFVSPQNDNGYDVADYRNIDPVFGSMEDFDELVSEAKERDIAIMLDMVFNHTSTEHEWFQKALKGDPTYLDYYKFVDAAEGATEENPGEPPTNWVSKFGGSAWQYVPSLNKWYLHLFDKSQADLNWDNPRVRNELADVIRFWKEKGVSAFRFDVVNLISKPSELESDDEGDGRRFYTDGPHVHEYLQELVREAGIDDLMTVGEMSSTSIDDCVRYSKPDCHELAMAFSFHHLKVDYLNGNKWALAEPDISELRRLFSEWQERMLAEGGWNALFWSNHDQPRPNSRFGDVSTRELWRRSSEMLGLCTHLMRGTPYVYQGEELGMTNPGFASIDDYRDVETKNYYKILQDGGMSADEAFHVVSERSRDNSRTPVQWDGSDHAGFTSGTPWIGVPDNHLWLNAAVEEGDPDSVWIFYRDLISLRKENAVIQRGTVRFLESPSDKVIAYERTLGQDRIVVACNFSGEDVTALSADTVAGSSTLIANCGDLLFDEDGALSLRPYEAVVLAW